MNAVDMQEALNAFAAVMMIGLFLIGLIVLGIGAKG